MWMLITAISEHVKEIGILIGALVTVVGIAVKIRTRAMNRIETTLLEAFKKNAKGLSDKVEAIDAKIGRNGGGTIHDSLHEIKVTLKRQGDEQKILGMIGDAVSRPQVIFSSSGEPRKVNSPFHEAFGFGLSEIQGGGWRGKLAESDKFIWDDVLDHKSAYAGPLTIGSRVGVPTMINPVFADSGELLAYSATFDARAQIAIHA